MTKLLNSILIVLSAWLIVSPLIFGYEMIGLISHVAVGVLLLVVALVAATRKKEYKPAINYLSLLLGILCVVGGIITLVMGMGFGVNAIISGLLIAAISSVATRFTKVYKGASFYDRGGAPMLDLESLRVKDGNILMKALLLQSMPSTVYVKPEEVWKILTMIPPEFLFAMPKYLYTGYKVCKEQEAKAASE